MMSRTSRIAKNTAFLYIRMLVTMGVGLYTTRVLLSTLGQDDFGLYHVIAGFVVLLGFLQGALSGTTQRFIAYELGLKGVNQLREVLSMSVNIHLIFAIVLLFVGGGAGYYIVSEILTYESSREEAVLIVFTFSLLSFSISIISVPFHAMIIAHEKMKIFAWVSVADALLKLLIVYLLDLLPFDALASYGVLLFIATSIVAVFYYIYVWFTFPHVRFKPYWNRPLFKTLVAFSGWTIWGNAGSVLANQGTNILLNVFFGPAINAAKSIGSQASGALNQFVTNLQSAINPQIIKSYSAKDLKFTNNLLNYGSKYNFFLIFTLAMPVLMRTGDVLNIWLLEPPLYASIFLKLILINAIIESVSRPLITAAQATGNIKLYQLFVGGVLLLNLPLSYLMLEKGYRPESVLYVAIILTIVASFIRIIMLKRIFVFSFYTFFRYSLLRIFAVAASTIAILASLNQYLPKQLGIIFFMLYVLLSFTIVASIVWFLGFETHERNRVLNMLKIKQRIKGF